MQFKYLAIPFISSLLFSACTLPFINQSLQSPESTVNQNASPDCNYDKSICQYMAAQAAAFQSGLTMTSVVTTTDKSTHKTISQMDGQGNIRTTSYKGNQEIADMIVVDKITYLKDNTDNSWLKMDITPDNQESTTTPESTDMLAELKQQLNPQNPQMVFTKLGEEACGQYTCEIYEYFLQPSDTTKAKIWIDTDKHLLRQMEMTTESGVNVITYDYSPVSISTPSPVKEFSLPQTNPFDGKTPSQQDIDKMLQQLPQPDQE